MGTIARTLHHLLFLVACSAMSWLPTTGLIAGYECNESPTGVISDITGNHHPVVANVGRTTDRHGNASKACLFSESSLTITDHPDFSITTTGYLSISLWIRPDGSSLDANGELLFADTQGSGYVHYLGKGTTSGPNGNREYSLRIYSADNSEGRHNRMSAYAFPYFGGLGPGSYWQAPFVSGTWMHYVVMYSKPDKRVWLYRNGTLVDSDSWDASSSHPIDDSELLDKTAPVRIGTQDGGSHFVGAMDDIYFFNTLLSASDISALYND